MGKVIKVKYGDAEGTLNENEVWAAADEIEEEILLFELVGMMVNPLTVKIGKLAKAFSILCRYAGIKKDVATIRRDLKASLHKSPGDEGRFQVLSAGMIKPLYEVIAGEAPKSEGDTSGNEETPAS